MKTYFAACAASMMLVATAAHADERIVTGGTGLPSATTWGFIPTENTGTTVITGTAPQSGNGSLELRGDRTRFQMGIQYGGQAGATNLMSLSNVTGLAFDWRIAGDSISGYNPLYTPALRLLVQDGNTRSELIWEGVYNGTYSSTQRDAWYSSTFGDNFYQFVAGAGVTTSGGSQVNKTLSSWISDNYSANAFVSAISVGDGSGALPTYHAFADNVRLGTVDGMTTTYNFELVGSTSAVPEPASWAMMFGGIGIVGGAARFRRKRTRVAFA